MLSALKATTPAPANSSRPNTTMARRLRQKATRVLNTARTAEVPVARSVARRSLEQVAEEDSSLGYRELVGLESRQYLVSSLTLEAECECALGEVLLIGRDPDNHRAIALAYYGCGGHGEAFHGVAGADDHSREHPRSQLSLGILHPRPHTQ